MKKKILALCLIVAMAAIAVIGGTLAYFTDTSDVATNTFTAGSVEIVQHEEQRDANGNLVDFVQDKIMVPAVGKTGDEEVCADETIHGHYTHFIDTNETKNVMDKIVSVENKSTVDIYAATLIAVEDTNDVSTNFRFQVGNTSKNWIKLRRAGATSGNNIQIRDELTGTVYTVNLMIYDEKIAPEAYSPCALTQVYMKPTATQDTIKDIKDKYDIACVSLGVQAAGFDNADEAIKAAFEIDYTNLSDDMIKTIAGMFGANFTPGYYSDGGFTPIN